MSTQTFTETLVIEHCCNCGVAFGLSRATYDRRLADHKNFYCPAGHQQHYVGKTEAQQQRERADAAERRARFAREDATFWRERAGDSARSAAAYKGHATRIRNLIAQGICPVPGCRRNFANVRAHIASQHPDWHKHDETGTP